MRANTTYNWAAVRTCDQAGVPSIEPAVIRARPPRASLEVALEFAGGGEGLHHELHGGQQFAGARVVGGEVHRGERAVVDAQCQLVAVEGAARGGAVCDYPAACA
ncbi:hypothetical protein GCM10010176_064930 [Nonomuraea spiralis]|nr:hypothetical protein GCM10010176_064930 [Nonomuraea spiralis]